MDDVRVYHDLWPRAGCGKMAGRAKRRWAFGFCFCWKRRCDVLLELVCLHHTTINNTGADNNNHMVQHLGWSMVLQLSTTQDILL